MLLLLILLSCVLLLVLFMQWVNYRQVQLQLDDFQASVDAFVHQTIEQQVTLEHMLHAATTSVEDVHKAFSDVSFDILDSMPRTQEVSKHMRRVHDQSASGVYGTVRSVGKGLGLIRNEISSIRKQRDAQISSSDKDQNKKPRGGQK